MWRCPLSLWRRLRGPLALRVVAFCAVTFRATILERLRPMLHRCITAFVGLCLCAGPVSAQKLDSLLARMTLDEKLGQLNLLSAAGENGRASNDQIALARAGKLGGLFNVIGAEAGREYNETEISERTMREIYLPPFKAAVDAGVASLMSAFNDNAGVPSSGNAWLTDTVLRREWRFKGFVVSDWTSVAELIPHGVAGGPSEAGRRALTAGVDMDMQSSIYMDSLPALVRSGRIPMAVVDSAVMRILRAT